MFEPGKPWDVGPVSESLLAFASTTWTPPDLKLAGMMSGWPVEEDRWGPRLTFDLGGRPRLRVWSDGNLMPQPREAKSCRQHGTVLLYYHWEGNYLRHEEFNDLRSTDFDDAYQAARNRISGCLGRPEFEDVYREGWFGEDPHYHFGIWRGDRGLLILQHGETDLYSGGVDLSVCLHPWESAEPSPRLPIIVNRLA